MTASPCPPCRRGAGLAPATSSVAAGEGDGQTAGTQGGIIRGVRHVYFEPVRKAHAEIVELAGRLLPTAPPAHGTQGGTT